MPYARQQRYGIALEALTRSATVAEASPGELVADRLDCDVESRRKPFYDYDEAFAVRLACC